MPSSLQIKIVELDSYLRVIHHGSIDDMDTALRYFRLALNEAQRLEKSGILADLTAVEHTSLSAIDRIIYFQSASEIYNEALSSGRNALRLAILQSPDSESHYTPGIDTGRGNGMKVQLFNAEHQAISWLNY